MILDTCALLWLAHDQSHFTEEILRAFEVSPVNVSAISCFEISLKHRSGKLYLPVPPREWFKEITLHHRIDIISLDEEICLKAAELPQIHNDPCDRFIIATALIRKLPVVTADRRFSEYGIQVFL